ncbi:MAG: hypothetical protein ABIJ09_01650 [Pseudomonadota bacterium]
MRRPPTLPGTLVKAALLGLLTAQLVVVGCPHSTQNLLERSRRGVRSERAEIEQRMQEDPTNATLLALEQSYTLLRSALPAAAAQDDARALLEAAHASFEDLSDPANLNVAFSADADKPYRGRPHERVLSTTLLALLDMAQGRCDMAVPTLRSAEFLDARWQPFPFGTDAPLVYALLLRCAQQSKGAATDVERARTGLLLSTRLMLGLEPALDLLHRAQLALPRGESIATRLAALLFEQALPAVLINRPQARSSEDLVRAAAEEAQRYLGTLDEALQNEQVQALLERVERLAPGYGTPDRILAQAETLLLPELMRLDAAMRVVLTHPGGDEHPAQRLTRALGDADALVAQIEAELLRDVVVLRFSGKGPTVEQEGEYSEVAVIRPGEDGSVAAEIRRRPVTLPLPGCGLHSTPDNGLIAVLCRPGQAPAQTTPQQLAGVELWSSSYQATSVVGRRFERVLAGRAQFKSGAENVSAVTAWTAWILFQLGAEILGGCSGGDGELCVVIGLVVLSIAVLGAVVAGAAWLAGAAVNPSADDRYVHNLFESGELLLAPAAAAALARPGEGGA